TLESKQRNDAPLPKAGGKRGPPGTPNVHQEASLLLLARYAPPGVIVDESFKIVQFRGQTGPFLEPSPGEATLNLLKMVREGLLNGTRSALQESRKSGTIARRKGLPLKRDGKMVHVNVVVIPLSPTSDGRFHLVLFEEPGLKAESEREEKQR